MAKLSVIIPSRDERFLIPTIHDVFSHSEGELEVVAVLDSDKWPENWKNITDAYPNLHTIHNGTSRGMRYSINAGVASAVSRGAKYVMKLDGHCSLSQGFDEVLKKDCDKDWVVVPRRGRLDPENWVASDTNKLDIDYHYLSFPDDPDDFGGPGLNGKVWEQRARERASTLVDDEMSSQGSAWFMHADHFNYLDLMDEAKWGTFWCEFQEIGFHAWLSGGQVKINKNAKYLHLHKGKKYGRGYRLDEKELQKGRTAAMLWPWNEDGWAKQTLPFSWLIEHFWPVPTWPDNWEEVLYASRRPRSLVCVGDSTGDDGDNIPAKELPMPLKIHNAYYGIGDSPDKHVDVTEHLQSLVKDGSLDIVVNNSTLTPNQNPFRGKKKTLRVRYSINGGEDVVRLVPEKDWLIIGPVKRTSITSDDGVTIEGNLTIEPADEAWDEAKWQEVKVRDGREDDVQPAAQVKTIEDLSAYGNYAVQTPDAPRTAAALNDYLIRKFQISDRRLRGPMPIELRDFHRNDLAQLFAELGFKRGAEIGVAEGHYSEILLKANPELELLLVDPWRRYDGNPYAHSQEHQDFSLNETRRKTAPYPNVRIMQDFSMNAVREVEENSLDFAYVDAHHGFDWVMEDLITWGRRVRSGGIISGDDYYHFKRSWAGVVEAVNAYTLGHRITPWFLIDAPRSVDFFWVKI